MNWFTKFEPKKTLIAKIKSVQKTEEEINRLKLKKGSKLIIEINREIPIPLPSSQDYFGDKNEG